MIELTKRRSGVWAKGPEMIFCETISKWFIFPDVDTIWLEISDEPLPHSYEIREDGFGVAQVDGVRTFVFPEFKDLALNKHVRILYEDN